MESVPPTTSAVPSVIMTTVPLAEESMLYTPSASATGKNYPKIGKKRLKYIKALAVSGIF